MQKLDKVKDRILGMVGQIAPSVIKRALSHPGLLPVFREIFAENPLKLIKEKKSSTIAGVAQGASWFGLLNPKEKVLGIVDPILKSASKQAFAGRRTLLQTFGERWRRVQAFSQQGFAWWQGKILTRNPKAP